MLNAVKSVLADISSVSPSSEQRNMTFQKHDISKTWKHDGVSQKKMVTRMKIKVTLYSEKENIILGRILYCLWKEQEK